MAINALNNYPTLANYSFLSQDVVLDKISTPQPFLAVKFDKKLVALIVVFGVLVAILIILVLMM
jgi:hypothetical protein